MGASPMLALGNIEWAGAKDILSHGRIKSPVGQGGSKMTKVTYPRFVDIDRNGISMKVFETSNGNEEWCSPTGRELQNSPEPMDHWLEYEDSEGELHYGR